ncbi:hypothetical protein Trydic_g6599 [Trypoxylus dichotomus]
MDRKRNTDIREKLGVRNNKAIHTELKRTRKKNGRLQQDTQRSVELHSKSKKIDKTPTRWAPKLKVVTGSKPHTFSKKKKKKLFEIRKIPLCKNYKVISPASKVCGYQYLSSSIS